MGDVPAFRFDASVAAVFPDMLRRSIPGYATVIQITGQLAGRFTAPDSLVYDLGASLGASTFSILPQLPPGARVIALDNSEAMIRRLQATLDTHPQRTQAEARCEDILNSEFDPCHFSVLNYTLQFIPLAERDALLQRIADATVAGGALVLSEKIALDDPAQSALHIDLHHDFKRANGYSDLEVSQKRSAIEDVLIPEHFSQHQARLLRAGFSSVEVWFRCFNFCSMVAIK